MIKIFTTNHNGKIELTQEELQNLVNEAYWEGYYKANQTITINTPQQPYNQPYYITCDTSTITLCKSEDNEYK